MIHNIDNLYKLCILTFTDFTILLKFIEKKVECFEDKKIQTVKINKLNILNESLRVHVKQKKNLFDV